MKFDLDEIQTVFFRCKECRTAVSFPRIRLAALPKCCPNCGSCWMQEPSPRVALAEGTVMRAFQAADAFRDALQALVTLMHSAGFTVGMEAAAQEVDGGNALIPVSRESQKDMNGGKAVLST